jgi:hypothetical protein
VTSGTSDSGHSPQLHWGGRVCSSHFRMLVTSSSLQFGDTRHKLTMSGFHSDLSSAYNSGATRRSQQESESHSVTLRSRKWRAGSAFPVLSVTVSEWSVLTGPAPQHFSLAGVDPGPSPEGQEKGFPTLQTARTI